MRCGRGSGGYSGGEKMLELGTVVGRYVQEIPKGLLTTSVSGKHYHLRIEISGVLGNEVELARRLTNDLWEKFRAEVKYIRIDGNTIDIQLEGSPFAWAVLIPWLPAIFTLFGITLIGIAIYTVFTAIPGWAWAALAIGIVFLLLAPSTVKLFKPVR